MDDPVPVKAGVWGTGPAVPARLREHLGPEVHVVPVGMGGGDGAVTWPDRLVAGDVDIVLCPVGPALEVQRGPAEVMGMTRRCDPRDLLFGAAGVAMPPEECLHEGAVVVVPCARSAGLARARHPGVRVVRGCGLRRDLARVDRGEIAAVVATFDGGGSVPKTSRAAMALPLAEWVPAPGSGSLAILVRPGATGAAARVARAMTHRETTRAVSAELAVARALGTVPGRGVGVIALPMQGGLRLVAMVVSEDGRQLVRGRVVARNGTPPPAAAECLVNVLLRRGAGVVGAVAGQEGRLPPERDVRS